MSQRMGLSCPGQDPAAKDLLAGPPVRSTLRSERSVQNKDHKESSVVRVAWKWDTPSLTLSDTLNTTLVKAL